MMKYGDRLKKLRTTNNLSMQDISDIFYKNYNIKISKSMISAWERNISAPTNTYAVAYSKYFNVKLEYLLGLIDEPLPLENTNPLIAKIYSLIYNLSDDDLEKLYEMIKLMFVKR